MSIIMNSITLLFRISPYFIIAILIFRLWKILHRRIRSKKEKQFKAKIDNISGGRKTQVLTNEFLHEEVAMIMARARRHDPLYSYLIPDGDPRVQFSYLYTRLCLSMKNFLVVTTSDDEEGGSKDILRCCSIWSFSKDKENVFLEIIFLFRFLYISLFYGHSVFSKKFWGIYNVFLFQLSKMENEIMKDSKEKGYYTISFLGTDPTSQSKGYGSCNLKKVIELADKEKRCIYVVSSSKRNLPFYGKWGFKIIKESNFFENTPTFHCRRDPISN